MQNGKCTLKEQLTRADASNPSNAAPEKPRINVGGQDTASKPQTDAEKPSIITALLTAVKGKVSIAAILILVVAFGGYYLLTRKYGIKLEHAQ